MHQLGMDRATASVAKEPLSAPELLVPQQATLLSPRLIAETRRLQPTFRAFETVLISIFLTENF